MARYCAVCRNQLAPEQTSIPDWWETQNKISSPNKFVWSEPAQLELPLQPPPVPKHPPKSLPAFYFHTDDCHCGDCQVTW